MTLASKSNSYAVAVGSASNSIAVPIYSQRAPTSSDIQYPVGKRWIDMVSNVEYTLTSMGNSNPVGAVWTLLGAGAGVLNTLSDGTTVVTPTGGNIEILGGANGITSTGTNAPGAISLTVSSTFVGPGSIASTTTLASGTSLAVGTSATVGTTLVVTGATTLAAVSGTTATFSSTLHAGGATTLATTLAVTGATTLAALTQVGTANINASGAGVTTIGTGGTGAVNIGNATGNTAVTGSLTASTGLVATTGGLTITAGGAAITGTTTINTTGAATTTIGTGGTGVLALGNATGNTAVTGSLTASTTLTATLGAITATNGNLVLGTTGNKLVIHATTAASDSIGTSVAMITGTVTVATTAVTAASKIFLSVNTPGGTQGVLSAPSASITAGTSFVINSSSAIDTSTVNYWIVN